MQSVKGGSREVGSDLHRYFSVFCNEDATWKENHIYSTCLHISLSAILRETLRARFYYPCFPEGKPTITEIKKHVKITSDLEAGLDFESK